MTTTFERSYFAEQGADDLRARQAKDAERDHHERMAAIRVVAALAADATEAREVYAMLGLGAAELREARHLVTPATSAPVDGVATDGVSAA